MQTNRKLDSVMDTYIIITLSMLLCINGRILVCLEYPNKHDKLHQGQDYILFGIALILIVIK